MTKKFELVGFSKWDDDDEWTLAEYDTAEEALDGFAQFKRTEIGAYYYSATTHIRLLKHRDALVSETLCERQIQSRQEYDAARRRSDAEWESEQRWESRMLYGEDIYG